MIRFKIYTYEFKPIKQPAEGELFEPDVNWEESIEHKQDIFGQLFHKDSALKFKRGNIQTFDHLVVAIKDDIIVMRIANNSSLTHEDKFQKWEEEDHPSLSVIIDNRKNKQIMAIEVRPQAFSDPQTVANIMEPSFNRILNNYRLELQIDAKYHMHEFWNVEALCEHGVACVKFKFPFPNLPEITNMVENLYKDAAESMNGEPTTILTARPKERLTLEKDNELLDGMIKAASASGKLIMMRPKGQLKWKQIGTETPVYEELSEQVFERLEDGELIPVKWHAIEKFLDRIKTVYE